MTIAMAASFLLVQAIAVLVIMRFFDRLKGPDSNSEEFREWLKNHPEALEMQDEDQYGG